MKRFRILALVVVLVLVVGILMAKTMPGGVDQKTVAVDSAAPEVTATATVDRAAPASGDPTSAAAIVDSVPTVAVTASDLSPEQQFEAAASAHKPTLALFHSLTCESCKVMVATLEEVRPDYAGKVEFVDVNVYETANTNLCRSARIQYIPTTVLVNAKGEASSRVGAMEPDQLRALLNQLLTTTSG